MAGIATRAERDGDGYRLTGSKLYITSGTRADLVTVLARTGPERHTGLTFFVVERDMPGFSVSRALKKTGWWASDTAELVFEDVRVPLRESFGEEGSAFVARCKTFRTSVWHVAFTDTPPPKSCCKTRSRRAGAARLRAPSQWL